MKSEEYKPGQANCRSRGGGWRRGKETTLSHWHRDQPQDRPAAMWWGGVLLRKSKEAQMWEKPKGKAYLE